MGESGKYCELMTALELGSEYECTTSRSQHALLCAAYSTLGVQYCTREAAGVWSQPHTECTLHCRGLWLPFHKLTPVTAWLVPQVVTSGAL